MIFLKKSFSLLCFIVLLFISIPVKAEERTMIQIPLPSIGNSQLKSFSLGFEKEFTNNYSFLILSDLYFYQQDYYRKELLIYLLSGMRFYHGSDINRYYLGLYYEQNYHYLQQYQSNIDQSPYNSGILGTIGYEWRFGASKSPCIWIESGWNTHFIKTFEINPVMKIGFGFNL